MGTAATGCGERAIFQEISSGGLPSAGVECDPSGGNRSLPSERGDRHRKAWNIVFGSAWLQRDKGLRSSRRSSGSSLPLEAWRETANRPDAWNPTLSQDSPTGYVRQNGSGMDNMGLQTGLESCFLLFDQTNSPTTAPVMHLARVPATIAFMPREAISDRLSGTMVPIPPIMIPRLPGLANPQRA